MTQDALTVIGEGEFTSSPESLQQLIANMTPAVFASLRQAIELGKWADGRRLNQQQLDDCMQLVILYEAHWLPESEWTYSNLPQGCGANPVTSFKPRGRH